MTDDDLARLEERLAALEEAPEVTPTGVDANGWPTYVAAGELIEASWGNAVVDKLKLPGRLIFQVSGKITGTVPAAVGITDVMTLASVVMSPAVNCVVVASAVVSFGNGPVVNGNADMIALLNSTNVANGPNPYQAVAGGWQAIPLFASWSVPAGGVIGYKVRINVSAAANAHAMGTIMAFVA